MDGMGGMSTSFPIFFHASETDLKHLKGSRRAAHLIVHALETRLPNVLRRVEPRRDPAHLQIKGDEGGIGDMFEDGEQLRAEMGGVNIHLELGMGVVDGMLSGCGREKGRRGASVK